MRISAIAGVCLLPLLIGNGCVNTREWNAESQNALDTILTACVARGMTRGELVMQVGQPTAKEAVEDGEIWVYDLVDRGDTTTTGQVGAFGTFSATSSTPEAKSRITIRFNQKGVMIATATAGPARGQFRFLRPPQR
jgi:hypothetical protein